MSPLHVVILAAGKGTRMKSRLPKVLHPVAGRPMLESVLDRAAELSPSSITVVIGHEAEAVRRAIAARPGLRFALQEPQLGTGHALLQTKPLLAGEQGTLLLLSGDVPLLRTDTLRRLREAHDRAGAAATVLTARVDRPDGYGRIVRRGGRIARIVEDRDASDEERRIDEINTGIYAFALGPLFDALAAIGSGNAQGEHYLPDLVAIYRSRGLVVETVELGDTREMQGINSRADLAEASALVRRRRCEELMAAGVTIVDPATTYIGELVAVGADTTIHPGVHLQGRTTIGERCEIFPGVRIVDSTLGSGVTVLDHCLITSSTIGDGVRIGPFAHIRPESEVMTGAHIGNFVELKKTTLGEGSKANHLTYLGDAVVGAKVNVGAGTITCNYDGEKKHRTVIEDGAFIGSDTQLVAPVTVGRGAYVAAGSSITEDVPPGALAVARGRQVNKEGWVESRRKEKQADSGGKKSSDVKPKP